MLTFHQFLELAEGIPKPVLGLLDLDRAATNHKSTTANLLAAIQSYLMTARDVTLHEKHQRCNQEYISA